MTQQSGFLAFAVLCDLAPSRESLLATAWAHAKALRRKDAQSWTMNDRDQQFCAALAAMLLT
jgi:hypothetical protein